MKALIIGLGFAGSIMARQLAEAGYKVTAIEKRHHIGGNMYEEYRQNQVRVHLYGPHIFHTNNPSVMDYLEKFDLFYPYHHTVLGDIKDTLVPIPFNFTSIDAFFSEAQAGTIKNALLSHFPGEEKTSIANLLKSTHQEIAQLGRFIYDYVFVNYTVKQWGIPIADIDPRVINRVPVVLSYKDGYFTDTYQKMPTHGYTALFEKILHHPNITVQLNQDAFPGLRLNIQQQEIFWQDQKWEDLVIFTGMIDQLFHYQYGALPYRSLKMEFLDFTQDFYQTAPVINFPNQHDFTRITEFKYLTNQKIPGHTSIAREYPLDYKPNTDLLPYYPINNPLTQAQYDQYLTLSKKFPQLHLCGRLAQYQYFNMDQVIAQALELSGNIVAASRN